MTSPEGERIEPEPGGDATADRFAKLLERHLPGLRGFLRNRAASMVLARESADDLAQSACRDVLEHLGDGRFELRTDAEFKQWLYEAGLLKLRSRVRFHGADKRDAGLEVPQRTGTDSRDPGFEPATSATPSRLAATEESRARVRAAIDALGERDAQILRLAVLEGKPHKEVAQVLGLEVAHCRMVLSRAMAKLSGKLQSAED